MSDTNDAASKTEEPTQHKLDQAREKGDVVKTMDLGQFANLAAVAAVIVGAGGWMSRNLARELTPFFSRPHDMLLEGSGGVEIMRYAVMAGAPIVLAVMAAAMFSGTAA